MPSASNINGIAVSSISKVDNVNLSAIASINGQTVASTPALPAFTSIALSAGLWSFNPVGYVDSPAFQYENTATDVLNDVFIQTSPYSADWATATSHLEGTPPFFGQSLYDQNSNANDLTQSGAARPVLQVTSPVVVTGIGAGTYTFSGVTDNGAGGFWAYYNLEGQATSISNFAIIAKASDGDNSWSITNGAGATLSQTDPSQPAFPWLATFTGSVVSAGTQTGEIDFGTDGAGGAATTGLQGGSALCNSATGTIYILFKAGSLVATEVLFETGTGAAGSAKAKSISISLVAGVLTATIYDDTAVTPLANTKIKTISDTNWHLLALTWDVSLAAASQVGLKVDNSATGVTAPVSNTLTGLTIGNAVPNIGARNNATSAPFTGSAQIIIAKTVADNASTQTGYYNYIKTLNTALT